MRTRNSGVERRLLTMLERLLEIPAEELHSSLDRACELVLVALGADKVDAMLHDPATDTLEVMGISNTALGMKQRAIGLDRQPIANGGKAAAVYESGQPYLTGHADRESGELPGIVDAMGVRSHACVPLESGGLRRGVLDAQSRTSEFFSEVDLDFLVAVSRWVGAIVRRAELVEQTAASAEARGRRAAADDLITILAHDLRNYLAPLGSRVDLLRRRAVRDGRPDDVRDADAARTAITRLSRAIADLLDVARLHQGIFSLATEAIDLVSLAHESAAALATREVDVRVESPPELVINADPERLRQALDNLVGNAVKHSPRPGTVHIQIATERDREGEWATIDVVDRGPGIPDELVPRLFERFTPGPGSNALGLGLYLAREVARAHRGEVTAASTTGHGARFRLTLPLES